MYSSRRASRPPYKRRKLLLGMVAAALLSSPASLWAAGEQGWWYDNSDFSTMYQDSTGTTPVTAVEQPVGLQLDKRFALVRGSELNSNNFSANLVGWQTGSATTAAIVGGEVQATFGGALTSTDNNWFGLTGAYVVGKLYEVVFDATFISGGDLQCGAGYYVARTVTGAGNGGIKTTYRCIASGNAPSGSMIVAFAATSAGSIWKIDNISVREIPGNHRIQATAASRPTLSARYNLLTKSEQFDDAVWTKLGATTTANAVTAPNGEVTADKITEDTAISSHRVAQIPSVVVGSSYIYSVYVKAAERGWALIEAVSGASDVYAYVNLATGEKGNSLGTSTVSGAGNGWWLVRLTITAGDASLAAYVFSTPVNGTSSYQGVAGSGIYAWGADLRLTTDTTGKGPAYQRVNTATDYDIVGFLHSLKYDGIDDSLATAGTVDFTATDKVTVVAGVTKLSDVATAILVELSSTVATNDGSFYLAAPGNAGVGNYGMNARGTTAPAMLTAATYTSPATNVLTAAAVIGADSRVLRVNGVSAADAADLGAGNFGNHTAYFGRRGGSTLPFNGREYSNICVGKLATAAEINQVERYTNNRTGAY